MGDALYCIGYMEGITISQADFLEMHSRLKEKEYAGIDSKLWTAIVDHYRNYRTIEMDEPEKKTRREIACAALEKIKSRERFAYIDWQKLDDDDDDD